ncbi:NAD-dependent epimerase/dehydratase family protein [Allomuricauda sp. SCSIO 65647]|uniref:NAD-dependent epimerase/dehydratase family protein n=1 Tax=Allomuricauda sp. SCSIO 65647 TaxID=2908843 RepID=UPI001F3F42E1|nr:NAD-dependent epimerase/dehydratase family protein [Muricauda sp. SCSIO 65647]UJH66194.1 NAD-dependent epimerase/dehydratase family protein [Muricauda sp. SCSIO 65647]
MVLVTGGTGLIGSHLLFGLLKSGQSIKAIYRSQERLKKIEKVFSYYTDEPNALMGNITWIKTDLNDVTRLNKAMQGVEQVYHCAALISFDPAEYQGLVKANIEGTANVVNACLANKVKKLCYISSIAALGTSINGQPVDENTEWNDKYTTVYGLTKRRAELEVWRGTQEALPAIIINPGVVFGPGFWKSGSGSFFYLAAKEKKYAPPGGTGFVSVNDVVNAMIGLMQSEIKNERFVMVSKNWSYLRVLQKITGKMGKTPPKKELGKFTLELFWRLDWLRSKLFGKRRRLAKQTAKSLQHRQYYNSEKIKGYLNFEFEDLDDTIDFCCEKFKEDYLKLF